MAIQPNLITEPKVTGNKEDGGFREACKVDLWSLHYVHFHTHDTTHTYMHTHHTILSYIYHTHTHACTHPTLINTLTHTPLTYTLSYTPYSYTPHIHTHNTTHIYMHTHTPHTYSQTHTILRHTYVQHTLFTHTHSHTNNTHRQHSHTCMYTHANTHKGVKAHMHTHRHCNSYDYMVPSSIFGTSLVRCKMVQFLDGIFTLISDCYGDLLLTSVPEASAPWSRVCSGYLP